MNATRFLLPALLLGSAALLAADAAKAAGPHEGTWKPIAAVLGGVRLPAL